MSKSYRKNFDGFAEDNDEVRKDRKRVRELLSGVDTEEIYEDPVGDDLYNEYKFAAKPKPKVEPKPSWKRVDNGKKDWLKEEENVSVPPKK